MPFIITGQIRESESGIGLPNLLIQAWDKDTRFDDQLGECFTAVGGRFRITYTGSSFK